MQKRKKLNLLTHWTHSHLSTLKKSNMKVLRFNLWNNQMSGNKGNKFRQHMGVNNSSVTTYWS